jgi:hypothetical protein
MTRANFRFAVSVGIVLGFLLCVFISPDAALGVLGLLWGAVEDDSPLSQ